MKQRVVCMLIVSGVALWGIASVLIVASPMIALTYIAVLRVNT